MLSRKKIIDRDDGENSESFLDFTVTSAEMDAFRLLSGDTNPIHDETNYPEERGFDGALVYGGLLVAKISRFVGTILPGPGCVERGLTLRYRAPLYIDEPARLRGTVLHRNDDLGLLDIKLRIEASGRRVADGEAQTMIARKRPPTAPNSRNGTENARVGAVRVGADG
mgnify:CR=1 FL=1